MYTILKQYQEKYGIAEKYILSEYGGSVEEIIKEYKSNPPWPFETMLLADFSDADNIHNMVLRDIQRRYFQKIPRDRAVSVCNVLFSGNGDGTIKISSRLDLEYDAHTFMQAWNENNQDQEKIYAPVPFDN
jgi:hypothetical protein